MKKKIAFILSTLMLLTIIINSNVLKAEAQTEMRASWITTVYNKDFPTVKNDVNAQKKEFIAILDQLKSIGINTVIVQVRPKGDALYKSSINPWSDVLTGVQGKDPGYDPMRFMIDETHKRGMEFHAWLNPYRVTTSGTSVGALSANHPARINPSLTLVHNGALFYNPELPEVKQHIVNTVKEIVQNYNIDGIHFDDYFYPTNYPLPEGEGRDGFVANQRRNHITEMIRMVKNTVKSVNTKVDFGVSPSGIWKNNSSDTLGSNTRGMESYYSCYADTRKWVKEGLLDYIAPQIYWQTGHPQADYETLVKWWSNQVSGTNTNLYIGQGIYKDEVAVQIEEQLRINKLYPEVKGSIYFTASDLLNNRLGCKDAIKKVYQEEGKYYYLDIGSFLGEETVNNAYNRLKNDTGWWLTKEKTNNYEYVYKIITGGFEGEVAVKSALKNLVDKTNWYATYEPVPNQPGFYRIVTGGFVGKDSAENAFNTLKKLTGWWATLQNTNNVEYKYRIITGGFQGYNNAKDASNKVTNVYNWYNTINERR